MRFIYTSLFFAGLAAAQTTQIALPQVYASGAIGLNGQETARWNVLNPAFPAPIVGPTCSVTLSFHDGRGSRVRAETFTLKAGETRSLSVLSTDIPSDGNPTGIYGLATVPLTGPTDQPTGPTCSLVTTMEVVDTATGETKAITRGEIAQPGGLRPANPIPLGQ
jgi:hypothetical protein